MRKISKSLILIFCGLMVIVVASGVGMMESKFKPYQETHQYMIHKDISCEQCHGTHWDNVVLEATKYYKRFSGTMEYKVQKVNPAKCAACHNGANPKAKEFINEGNKKLTTNTNFVHKVQDKERFNCIDCHKTISHGNLP